MTKRTDKGLVLLSGGIDSMACCHFLKTQGMEVSGLFVDFGQAACTNERIAAERVCDFLNISFAEINVSLPNQYGAGEVTGRNGFLIFSALMALKSEQSFIATGIHSGTDYYDCSVGFYSQMNKLVQECSNGAVTYIAPFKDWYKAGIVEYTRQNHLPFDLTYSCEAGTDEPCGHCLSCKDREAMKC
ncbi:7-cyano-7-deazaguanine synthase [Terasakiella sp. A23]|uniref:7-cyano-7-deazaguanine synthase n=1 Tax=Terasakiella sp. FCG-A23 TaxID=3080561 RepID=UPI0029552215|nr:7-cyano-7-deazaguanine synthase [Terasakiella sp. A23]MDV7341799.1 7-cyano-7-deazaguanine synthase [Terasakiella sp. A23]